MRLSKDVVACGIASCATSSGQLTTRLCQPIKRNPVFAARQPAEKIPALLFREYSKILLICVFAATGARDILLFQRRIAFRTVMREMVSWLEIAFAVQKIPCFSNNSRRGTASTAPRISHSGVLSAAEIRSFSCAMSRYALNDDLSRRRVCRQRLPPRVEMMYRPIALPHFQRVRLRQCRRKPCLRPFLPSLLNSDAGAVIAASAADSVQPVHAYFCVHTRRAKTLPPSRVKSQSAFAHPLKCPLFNTALHTPSPVTPAPPASPVPYAHGAHPAMLRLPAN